MEVLTPEDIKRIRRIREYERATITLTKELMEAIDEERGRARLSRSAFIEWCLREGRRVKVRRGEHY